VIGLTKQVVKTVTQVLRTTVDAFHSFLVTPAEGMTDLFAAAWCKQQCDSSAQARTRDKNA
jgi:hypothetical protein